MHFWLGGGEQNRTILPLTTSHSSRLGWQYEVDHDLSRSSCTQGPGSRASTDQRCMGKGVEIRYVIQLFVAVDTEQHKENRMLQRARGSTVMCLLWLRAFVGAFPCLDIRVPVSMRLTSVAVGVRVLMAGDQRRHVSVYFGIRDFVCLYMCAFSYHGGTS